MKPDTTGGPEERARSLEVPPSAQPADSPRPAYTARPRPNLRRQAGAFPATFGLIGTTLGVFLLQLASQSLLGYDLVLALGAKINPAIAQGQIWRLVTPLFIHAGITHALINMYSLYAIGPAVEQFFGRWRTLILYLLSGVAGVLLSLAFSPSPSVGASGAIFGLLGGLGAFLYRNRTVFGGMGRSQLQRIVLVALFNLALGLSPGIDNWGHLGGLLYGIALAWVAGPVLQVVAREPDRPALIDRRSWDESRSALLLGAALLIALSLAAIRWAA